MADGTKKEIVDYVGKPKGLRQILWERGFWNNLDPEFKPKLEDQRATIAKCYDFEHEETALEQATHRMGHLLRMTPKGHPELAGVGIEYSWGKIKLHYRRNNNLDTKRFHSQVLNALSTDVLSLDRVRKFARRARDYERAYASGSTNSTRLKNKGRLSRHIVVPWIST